MKKLQAVLSRPLHPAQIRACAAAGSFLHIGFRPLHQKNFYFGSVSMLHVSNKSGGIKCEVWGSLDNVYEIQQLPVSW